MSDGLASENANDIIQDSLGFMWTLHANGLSRYDGYNFKIYPYAPQVDQSPGPPADGQLQLDNLGNLWLISNQIYQPDHRLVLTRYDLKKDRFVKYFPDIKGDYISSVCIDSNTVWIATWEKGLYCFDIREGETKSYLIAKEDTIRSPFRRNAIFGISDRDSLLLLATGRGLWQFDKATKRFSRPNCHPADSSMFYNEPVVSIVEAPGESGQLNLSIYNIGLVVVDKNFSEKADIVLSDVNGPGFRGMARDGSGMFWFLDSNSELVKFDPKDKTLVYLKADPNDQYSISSNTITALTVDRDQNLWVTTMDRGINKLPRQSLRFYNYDFKSDVRAGAIQYKSNNKNYLMISNQSAHGKTFLSLAMVSRLNIQNLDFKKINLHEELHSSISQLAVGSTHLWIGTNRDGLIGLPYNKSSGSFEMGPARRIKHDPQNQNTISGFQTGQSYTISVIWEDSKQTLWVGTIGGGLNEVRLGIPYGEIGSVVRHDHVPHDSTSLGNSTLWWELFPEDENSFWIVTGMGLDLFRNGSFEHYLKDDYVMTIKRDSKGKLLVGTTSGLWHGMQGNRFSFQKDPSSLLTKGVYGFEEDSLGRLWISTDENIKCYDRNSNTIVQFGKDEGIDFTLDWVEKSSEGIFITVDWHGVTLFDPHSFMIDETAPQPVITRLSVNNEIPQIKTDKYGSEQFQIENDISVLDSLTLDHKHNNFTIEFSAMQMTSPERNLYRHKLEGFDPHWIETDAKNRTATYTNLDAGTYTFKVRASNHHGIWSDRERKLTIVVLPPPWRTTWAYTGYGIIIIGLLFGARKAIVQRERLKSNLKLAKVEQEKEHFELEKAKEVDKVKSAFFANISHEFRTPLTLIKGPVQELMEEFSNHPNVRERLKLVQRNADLVLKLINQLLDLAKLESGTLTVEKSNSDFNSFVSAVVNSFSSLAFQKNITLSTELPSIRYQVRFDKDKVETILINLINNAIKFTPAGGIVNVNSMYDNNSRVVITVTDNGIGIPEEQQGKVFERFHQVSETHKEVGTGIGLALVKELVALMDGTISLTSEPGKGSAFTITLPVEQLDVLTEVVVVETVARQEVYDDDYPAIDDSRDNGDGELPHILVVEDNTDLRKFIIDSLGKEFHFREAANGKEGMEMAFKFVPDVIISDVMMPEMDGIAMTGKIKNDIRTSHIPLILLTAKTTDESKLKGLGTGADDYLTKPFDKKELLIKVRNSIALRIKLREKIKLELLKEGPNTKVQSADEKFLYNVREIIFSRMSDEQLSVESLAEEVALSRSQLLRKVTALTGVSVNELIRTFRLQKAAQLLEQRWGPVTQVAYEVGFSNLSYFSKVFKEQYGVLPSEYAAKVE
jgi:signal transduction histidine kinase/DNA-binding response OmpR family regulator/ligand-binding sensor domain-containing protein